MQKENNQNSRDYWRQAIYFLARRPIEIQSKNLHKTISPLLYPKFARLDFFHVCAKHDRYFLKVVIVYKLSREKGLKETFVNHIQIMKSVNARRE